VHKSDLSARVRASTVLDLRGFALGLSMAGLVAASSEDDAAMHPRIPLPEHLSAHAFNTSAGAAAGLGRGRMRGADLEAPHRGARTLRQSNHTLRDRAITYASVMSAQAFFSHETAAALWGIPLAGDPERSSRPLDVGVPRGAAIPVGRGIRGHRLTISDADIVADGELRLTSRARTWCDLAPLLEDEELVAAGDHLLWRRHATADRCSPEDMVAAVSRWHGRRGRPAIERCLPLLSARSDSRPESIIRMRVRAAGLPAPAVNLALTTKAGSFLAQPDLSWPAYRVTLDYEGRHHYTNETQWEKDVARVPRLENNGWAHLRASRSHLRDSTTLMADLRRRLISGGWAPSGL
jgi:hypothetical protein